jgi:hypothetical protein
MNRVEVGRREKKRIATYTFDAALRTREHGAHESKVLGRAEAPAAHVFEATAELFA